VSRYNPSGPAVVIGPGPMTPAVKALVIANVAAFVVTFLAPEAMTGLFGLVPRLVVEQLQVWRVVTYLFIHDASGFMHILFNMLALWMFGVELEQRWGTRAFLRYYAVTGVGSGLATVAFALLPFRLSALTWAVPTVGASGAIYGLLLAWALLFPHRQILFMFIFPLPARVAAALMAAIAFFSAIGGRNPAVAEATHLAGFVIGWIYLKGPKNLRLDLQYRLTRWRMDRMRKRFNVHKGGRGNGRGGWDGRVH
jgi:membrane associated rhomboid family serine protease